MSFRDEINNLINQGNLEALLDKSAEFHGHICSYSAYGVKAGCYAMKKLKQQNEGMEEVIAVVETNNCFSDGIQVVTGCTFGNNALIFKDLGKTAVTVISRKTHESIRLVLNSDYWEKRKDRYPELFELFDQIVARRKEVSAKKRQKFFALSQQMSKEELQTDINEVFNITERKMEPPAYAPMFGSVICGICGEQVMESRVAVKGGRFACPICAGAAHFYMDGSGIRCTSERRQN